MNPAAAVVPAPTHQPEPVRRQDERRDGCTAPRHDTAVAYRHSRCRCAAARKAWRSYNLAREAGIHIPALVDATGSRRRIHALQAAGYPLEMIVAALGYRSGRHALDPLLSPRRRRMRRERADQITALYERWSRLPGPSRSARLRARRAGHPGPAQWFGRDIDDPTARPRGVADLPIPAAGPPVDGPAGRHQSAGDDPWAGAVCRAGTQDPDLWYRDEQRAARLCTPCPMRQPCLRVALVRNEPDGVWGGLTLQQRQDLRRALLAQLNRGEPLTGSAALEHAVATFGAGPR